jgi:hypothetical protein
MHIAFKFNYIHDNGLFTRLLKRIAERSPLQLTLYKEKTNHIIAASGDQSELEALAELVSQLIPQSLFLSDHSIEEIEMIDDSKQLGTEDVSYKVPYCPECQERVMKTLDPFEECSVCSFSDVKLSLDDLCVFTKTEEEKPEGLFEILAEQLIKTGKLSLPTFNGVRDFSLLDTQENINSGILICDPSELSNTFVITQDELDTLMMIEKPSLRLKPKIKFRAEYELDRPFYAVFFADDKITLALTLALSRKGVFAVYCDNVTSLRTASALGEHVIIDAGRDMLPYKHPMTIEQAACCTLDGFTALGNNKGLFLDTGFLPAEPCIKFISKDEPSVSGKGIFFEPAHAALRSAVLEHDLQGRSLCGIYLSRTHDSRIFCFSSKIGYTSLAAFSSELLDTPKSMLEAIAQMDEEGMRLVANYQKNYPKLYEQIENASFDLDTGVSMLSRLWAMAAVFIGLSRGGDIHKACEELEATALEFNGKSGPRIDYKVMKSETGYKVDPRLAIRSAMSFKLAGVDEYLLSFGFIDSLADFIAEQAELADGNIAIEGVSLNGSLFENRQLLMRGYNALSPNYTIYRNKRLPLDGANLAIGAVTLGSE